MVASVFDSKMDVLNWKIKEKFSFWHSILVQHPDIVEMFCLTFLCPLFSVLAAILACQVVLKSLSLPFGTKLPNLKNCWAREIHKNELPLPTDTGWKKSQKTTWDVTQNPVHNGISNTIPSTGFYPDFWTINSIGMVQKLAPKSAEVESHVLIDTRISAMSTDVHQMCFFVG